MVLRSTKRYQDSSGEENSPPDYTHVHRSKSAKLSDTDDNDEKAGPITPQVQKVLNQSSLNRPYTRSALKVPCKRSIGQRHLISDFLCVPANPLNTQLVTTIYRTPLAQKPASEAKTPASTYFSHRKTRVRKDEHCFADLHLRRFSDIVFEKQAWPDTAILDEKVNALTFLRWKDDINMGRNILIYGFGSHEALLKAFGKSDHCSDGAVLMINGSRNVTARGILSRTTDVLLGRETQKDTIQMMIDSIRDESKRIYVFVHGIDSPNLRKPKEQEILVRLAECPNVALVASMNHTNTSLLWDSKTFESFRWNIHAVHTSQHYFKQVPDRSPVINPPENKTGGEGDNAVRAIKVLQSFVSGAQQIFLILARHKLSPAPLKTPLKSASTANTFPRRSSTSLKSYGMPFDILFAKCKERFILSNASILRSHLREFMDHDILSVQKDESGTEIYIPRLDFEDLNKVVKEFDGSRIEVQNEKGH